MYLSEQSYQLQSARLSLDLELYLLCGSWKLELSTLLLTCKVKKLKIVRLMAKFQLQFPIRFCWYMYYCGFHLEASCTQIARLSWFLESLHESKYWKTMYISRCRIQFWICQAWAWTNFVLQRLQIRYDDRRCIFLFTKKVWNILHITAVLTKMFCSKCHRIGKLESFKEWHKCLVEKPPLLMVWEIDLGGLDTCLTFQILCVSFCFVTVIRATNGPGFQILMDNLMFPKLPTSLGCQWSWEIAA